MMKLLIGGSPCTHWSIAQTKNRETEPVRIGTIESAAAGENAESRQYRVYSPDAKGVTLAGTDGGGGVATGLYAAPVEVEPVNVTADGKAHTIRASCYKDGIRNMVGNTIDKKTCVAIRVGDMPNADGEVKGSQSGRIYSVDGKSVSLQARPNGGGADGAATGLYAVPAGMAWRGRGDSSSYEMRDDQKANAVTAVWHDEGSPCWTFETDIPHKTFTIMEDGEPWCIGIVFSMADLGVTE